MKKSSNTELKQVIPNIKRPGIHAKSKSSSLKSSKNYLKSYKGQGR